jgi:hypothetical protein
MFTSRLKGILLMRINQKKKELLRHELIEGLMRNKPKKNHRPLASCQKVVYFSSITLFIYWRMKEMDI